MSAGVWGLDTGRVGEFRQVETLARSLGLGFTPVPAGRPPPPGRPAAIVSFGRAAGAALRLKRGFAAPPLLVHLGTPGQHAAEDFDLILPMPQDSYPRLPNVRFLDLPLNGAGAAPGDAAARRGTVIALGGPSRQFGLRPEDVDGLLAFGRRLAAANDEALAVVTSPRTPGAVADRLRGVGSLALHLFGAGAALDESLRTGARFVITGDSASMLADALRTGAPVWLYRLRPVFDPLTLLQHGSDRLFGPGPRHALVRRGWLGAGTDFGRWHRRLAAESRLRLADPGADHSADAAALRWQPTPAAPDRELESCRDIVLDMLRKRSDIA